jgi:hypothetical protein
VPPAGNWNVKAILSRSWSILAALVLGALLIGYLTGCAGVSWRKPAQGGGTAATLPGGLSAQAAAPDSPATPTQQAVYRHVSRTYAPPAAVQAAPLPSPSHKAAAPAPGIVQDIAPAPPPLPSLLTEEITEHAAGKSGVAQADTSADTAARIASMRPVQVFGFALVLGALALFHPVARLAVGGGKQIQAIAGAAGVLCIFGPQLMAGNEPLLIWGGLAAVLGAWIITRMSRHEALADAAKTAPPPPTSV